MVENEPGQSTVRPGANRGEESEAAQPEASTIVAPHNKLDLGIGRDRASYPDQDRGKADCEK